MHRKLTLTLATALMMFPQIVETIYSPALPFISKGFNVTHEIASQTLSCYFMAFALGVIFWGRMCDIVGRRVTILSGIAIYFLASLVALFCETFTLLLGARMLAAFGAAVGSVGTQTAMRDRFNGNELARVFSLMGIAIAVSPAIGILAGAALTLWWGYKGVFSGLVGLAAALFIYASLRLPETRPDHVPPAALLKTACRMLKDADIWCIAFLIALHNLSLFSYYQLAPFLFTANSADGMWFGYTGFILAAGVGIGAMVNKYLVINGWRYTSLIIFSSLLVLSGATLVYFLQHTPWFVFPVVVVVMAYGIAIPNILARALTNYKDCTGTAGAILGLLYYFLLATGLVLAGMLQDLGCVMVLCGISLSGISAVIFWRNWQSTVIKYQGDT